MKTLRQLNKTTKLIFALGMAFTFYGYLCRQIDLFFFWESKYVGWAFIFIGIIGFLLTRIRLKKAENKKSIPEKIGIGIISFALLVQIIFLIIIPSTLAYSSAKEYLLNDAEIKKELGDVTGLFLIPLGTFENTSDRTGKFGSANLNFIVKGEKKFKDISVLLIKYPNSSNWSVARAE